MSCCSFILSLDHCLKLRRTRLVSVVCTASGSLYRCVPQDNRCGIVLQATKQLATRAEQRKAFDLERRLGAANLARSIRKAKQVRAVACRLRT